MLLARAKDSVDVLIVVRDIEKSLGFYQRTLGLEKTEELQTPFGVSHRLRYGTSLVKLLDPNQVPPSGPIGLEKQLGFRFVSFEIRNLDEVCAALERQAVEFVMPAMQATPDMRLAMVKDPDGNIVEFIELG